MIVFPIHTPKTLANGSPAAAGLRVRLVLGGETTPTATSPTPAARWLDPADPTGRTWSDSPPIGLWPGVPIESAYGADAAGTPLQGKSALDGWQIVKIPTDGLPDDALIAAEPYIVPGQAGVAESDSAKAIAHPEFVTFRRGENPPPYGEIRFPIYFRGKQP